MRRTIRGGMGLGDALYVQSVCRHLRDKGQSLRVHTAWPEVFSQMGPMIETGPFKRSGIDILAHYPTRKKYTNTTQFEDCCITAGIKQSVDLRMDWAPTNQPLLNILKARGRPIICVQLPRSPMGRTDGFGAELLPDCRVIQRAIDCWRGRAFIVQIGSGTPLYKFDGIDVDLAGQTTVSELLDVASIASGFIGYVSFVVPLAESFSKPALLIWSRRGLLSGVPYVRQITPGKILHKATSRAILDDQPTEAIQEASNALL